MNLKVQCACGARYSFDVEPVAGRMPFAVKCPNCGADGTEAANHLIAQASAAAAPAESTPPLRIHAEVPVPPDVTATGTESPLPESTETRLAVREMLRRRKAAEQRNYRLTVWGVGIIVALAIAAGGFFAWYWFSGSKPSLAYSTSFAGDDAAVQFVAPQRFLIVDDERAVLHDLKRGKDIWSASLGENSGSRRPQVFVRDPSIWICLANAVVQLDAATGAVKNRVPISGVIESFTPDARRIFVVSALDPTTRRATSIDLSSGAASSQDVTVPRAEKHLMPNELPANVAPTAGVLLAQAMDEQKFNKPLDAMSSQFFSAGENLVELRVQLVNPKVEYVQSIRPKGPSLINGETTASTSAFGVADEVFNDIKRSQTGGVKPVDESTYDVKIRRWTGGPQPVEWEGQSIGVPGFFPLTTVDLLAAGKTLIVFDKQNNKLFSSTLNFPVSDRFLAKDAAPGVVPGLEGPGGLYFFDQGVLSAFSLPGGEVRWRIPTVGVTKLQFDPQGMLYVDSTTATPQDIQYSDQISFDKILPMLMKIDPQSGKILWQSKGAGADSFVSGKFLYATSVNMGGVPIAMALGNALGNVPASEEAVHFRLYRIDPETGQTMWSLYHQGQPEDLTFQNNRFVLCYSHDVQAWKFLQL